MGETSRTTTTCLHRCCSGYGARGIDKDTQCMCIHSVCVYVYTFRAGSRAASIDGTATFSVSSPVSAHFEGGGMARGPLGKSAFEEYLRNFLGMSAMESRSIFAFLDFERDGVLELENLLDALTALQDSCVPKSAEMRPMFCQHLFAIRSCVQLASNGRSGKDHSGKFSFGQWFRPSAACAEGI